MLYINFNPSLIILCFLSDYKTASAHCNAQKKMKNDFSLRFFNLFCVSRLHNTPIETIMDEFEGFNALQTLIHTLSGLGCANSLCTYFHLSLSLIRLYAFCDINLFVVFRLPLLKKKRNSEKGRVLSRKHSLTQMLHACTEVAKRRTRAMIKRDVSTYLKISSRNLLHYCFLALTFTSQVPWYYPDSFCQLFFFVSEWVCDGKVMVAVVGGLCLIGT